MGKAGQLTIAFQFNPFVEGEVISGIKVIIDISRDGPDMPSVYYLVSGIRTDI